MQILTKKEIKQYSYHDLSCNTNHNETIDFLLDKILQNNQSKLNIFWLGRHGYSSILLLQKKLHFLRSNNKINDIVLLLEHEHVYTFGKNADRNHLLPSVSKDIDIEYTNRGGDVTYHGPGQLVGYPIINLGCYKKSISWYIKVLQLSIINLLNEYGIGSQLKDDYVGIWVEDEKIAAFGVRLSKWTTMHGFALNITTDMKYFDYMIPCGIFEYGVTSIKEKSDVILDTQEIAKQYAHYFFEQLVRGN